MFWAMICFSNSRLISSHRALKNASSSSVMTPKFSVSLMRCVDIHRSISGFFRMNSFIYVFGDFARMDALIQEVIDQGYVRYMVDAPPFDTLLFQPRLWKEMMVVIAIRLFSERHCPSVLWGYPRTTWLLVRQDAENCLHEAAAGAEVTVVFDELRRDIDCPIIGGRFYSSGFGQYSQCPEPLSSLSD